MSLGLKKKRFNLGSKKAVPARHHHTIKRHEKNLRPEGIRGFHRNDICLWSKIKMIDMFAALGFRWNREKIPQQIPTHSIDRVTFHFHRMLTTYVWDASVLEGNPFTFPEVKTLLEGVTVGGRKISDQEQVLNLAESSKYLLSLVKAGKFKLDKITFTELHGLVAKNEALEWGHFRGEGQETNYTPDVGLGPEGRYTPLPTVPGAPELNRVFSEGLQALTNTVESPFERAAAFFLFGALQQFFFDGNKRTSRFMMNGILMSSGMDAISIPAAKAQDFNEKMVRFYMAKDATEMMEFLVSCHPDAITIQQNNPQMD
jgi:prophage maintenance system killer protein